MVENMITKFDKYLEVVHGIMAVATILDPRYKFKIIDYFFDEFYGDKAVEEIIRVKKYCYELLHESESSSHIGKTTQSSSNVPKEDVNEGYCFLLRFKFYLNNSQKKGLKSELDQYLEEEVLPLTDNFYILVWWRGVGLRYPTLQKIAKDILAIQFLTLFQNVLSVLVVDWWVLTEETSS